jgi:hypothetical protein
VIWEKTVLQRALKRNLAYYVILGRASGYIPDIMTFWEPGKEIQASLFGTMGSAARRY